MKIKENKIILAIVLMTIALCCGFGLIYSQDLLHSFTYNGEAYMKGYGHILSENFDKGLRFLVVRHTSVSMLAIIPLLLVSSHIPKFQKLLNVIVIILFVTVTLYIGSKVYEINVNRWGGVNRTIEIATMCTCIFVSYVVSLTTIRLLLKR